MKRKYAANRIRQIRQERRMTLEELAHAISPEVSLTTIGKLETGRMALSLDWINDIAKALGVAATDVIEDRHGWRMLPVLGAVAAGAWGEAAQEENRWVPVIGEVWSGREFVLRVDGDSMDEIAVHGDYVVVDPGQAALTSGWLYAVANTDSETTFKRFAVNPPQLVPCSRNPAHKPLLIGSEPFTVLGRVTRVMRDLD
jgi:repressor LexA